MKRYKHRMPIGTNGNKAKSIASRDITEACGKNYIHMEAKILEFISYDFQYIQI